MAPMTERVSQSDVAEAAIRRLEGDVEELRGQRDFAMRELRAKIAAYDALSTEANRRLVRMATAEAAINAVRELHRQYRSIPDFDVCAGCSIGMEIRAWPCPTIAALDSTDPVEDAPKKRMCPDAHQEPGGCPTQWRYTEGGAWHQCEDIRSGPHPQHVCGCGTTVESPLFGGQLDAPALTRSGEEKPAVDLMAALRASVDRARASRGGSGPRSDAEGAHINEGNGS